MTQTHQDRGFRTPLSEKIFLDRYALKDLARGGFEVGDTVVFSPDVNSKYARREIGKIIRIDPEGCKAEVQKRDEPDSEILTIPFEHIDLPMELNYSQLCQRVADHLGESPEAKEDFFEILNSKEFVPGGRILAGAGTDSDLTLYNCYVVPSPKDSRAGILETAHSQFEIMSRGGGVGINVSSLRPKYDFVKGVNGRSSGAVSWADLYSIITGKVEQGGSRRGALMIILDVWHPDIIDFITSKHEIGKLDNANISVGITDAFMEAVENDSDWTTCFPDRDDPEYEELWDGDIKGWIARGKAVNQYDTRPAREIFRMICQSAWQSAEPGLFFTDRYNKDSNSYYYNHIKCCNPCGEQGLPDWGVCNLGALNLANFVSGFHETTENAAEALSRIDLDRMVSTTKKAIRFLDNVIDATPYVMEENRKRQTGERRVGLGIMGLAEMFIRMGIRYGSEESVEVVHSIFEAIRNAAYNQSADLAKEKGAFPDYDDALLESGFAKRLPESIREKIRSHGLRNVTLLTVAPTGTTGSMTATSTGIEPYFMFRFEQRGHLGAHIVEEPVVMEYREATGNLGSLPAQFVTTNDLMPSDHVQIMAAAQKYIDSSISKTCNLPHDYTVEQVEEFYRDLYRLGCKGGTIYRDGSRQEQCLVKVDETPEAEEPESVVEAPSFEVSPIPTEPRMGLTHSALTHLGRVHVTLNVGADGELFDAFIRLSKAGSDIDADTDAIGRLISLTLRLNSKIPTRRRLQLIVDQLRGIASSQSVGFGANRVRSVPDGIALCLSALLDKIDSIGDVDNKEPDATPERRKSKGFMLTCPACHQTTAVKADGCFKCMSCGHSAC